MQYFNEAKAPPGDPYILDLDMPSKNNVYSQELPIGTKKFTVTVTDTAGYNINFNPTEGDLTKFESLFPNQAYNMNGILLSRQTFINIQADTDNVKAKISYWL